MSLAKTVTKFSDVVTFTLYDTNLFDSNVGDFLETPKRVVPCSDGLEWWTVWYPAGETNDEKLHISLFLCVSKVATARFTIKANNFDESFFNKFSNDKLQFGWPKFESHLNLIRMFHNGNLTFTCKVEFDVLTPLIGLTPRLAGFCDHVPTDLALVTNSGEVAVHKSFISLMSPVFYAMFSHPTKEARSCKVNITDFDFETVKAATDFCYGREFENPSVDTIISILRFADKYDIKAVNAQLELIPSLNLSPETFCAIVHYAYDCSKDELLTQCCDFFKTHQDEIKDLEKFVKLPQTVVVHVLKTAFHLETDLDILRHCHKNEIEFDVGPLEQPFFDLLTIDDFCAVASYAWDCSRDDLKNACALFLSANRVEVTKLKEFNKLLPLTMVGLFKLSYQLEHQVESEEEESESMKED